MENVDLQARSDLGLISIDCRTRAIDRRNVCAPADRFRHRPHAAQVATALPQLAGSCIERVRRSEGWLHPSGQSRRELGLVYVVQHLQTKDSSPQHQLSYEKLS